MAVPTIVLPLFSRLLSGHQALDTLSLALLIWRILWRKIQFEREGDDRLWTVDHGPIMHPIACLSGFYLGFIVWGRSLECPKTTSFLGGSGACPPRNFFWNKCALRWNLVPFETILRNVTVCALTSSRLDDFSDIVYCTDDNIFCGESWAFLGGKLLPLKYPR